MKKVKKRNATLSKNKILKNAITLFSKNGYSSCSMDELAKMCDLNKAMIFYYYGSKQGLYEAVIIKVLDEIYTTVLEKKGSAKTPVEELNSFIKTYAFFACNHPYLPSLLLKELSDGGAKIPKMLFSHMKKLYTLFMDILQRGEKDGFFKDVVPMIVYFMLIGSTNLLVTTKSIRVEAYEQDGLDTCATCDIEDISNYLIKKINKMLKDD